MRDRPAMDGDYLTAASGASASLRCAVDSRFSAFMSALAARFSILAWCLASFLRSLYSALASESDWRFCTYGSLDWPELGTAVAFTEFGADKGAPVPRVGVVVAPVPVVGGPTGFGAWL